MQGWLPALLVLPAILLIIFVLIIPLFRILRLSLFDPTFSLEHYQRLFTVPIYSRQLIRTFRTALSVTALCALLGYPVAYLMVHVKRSVAALMLILVVLPFFTSFLVRTFAWRILLGRRGIINEALTTLGILDQPLTLLYNSQGVHVGTVHVMLPFMILPLYSVMTAIDPDLVPAARSLGANAFRAFRKVFLPLSIPGVVSGAVLIFVISLGFFLTPALLGGPQNTMIAQSIEINVNTLLEWGFASAEAIVLLIFTLLILGLLKQFFNVDILSGRLF